MLTDSWVVADRSTGKYSAAHMRLEKGRHTRALEDDDVLLETWLISVDLTTRNWLKLDPVSTFLPLRVGEPKHGQIIGKVPESRSQKFRPGDVALGMGRWETITTGNARYLEKIEPSDEVPILAYLSVLSHIGRAAAIGILKIGAPRRGETVVVSGAAGATGSLAAQLAKAEGCRVVGIAGGEAKCRYLTEELGVDVAIDYRLGRLPEALATACPRGIDVFFDNVGGEVLDAVLLNLAIGARIAICGAISQYDLESDNEAYGVKNLPRIMFRCALLKGFVVPEYEADLPMLDARLKELLQSGRLRYRAHVVDGFEKAADAVGLLFGGSNNGKLMVRLPAAPGSK